MMELQAQTRVDITLAAQLRTELVTVLGSLYIAYIGSEQNRTLLCG